MYIYILLSSIKDMIRHWVPTKNPFNRHFNWSTFVPLFKFILNNKFYFGGMNFISWRLIDKRDNSSIRPSATNIASYLSSCNRWILCITFEIINNAYALSYGHWKVMRYDWSRHDGLREKDNCRFIRTSRGHDNYVFCLLLTIKKTNIFK